MRRSLSLLHSISLLLILLCTTGAHSRPITSIIPGETDFTSDGRWTFLRLPNAPATVDPSCDQTYGFLPCTHSALGNLFLLAVYGYLMFLAARYLSDGGDMLLDILGPGIIGGLLLPIVGALPDAILILVSGLSGSKETAQQQVLIGMGLLAGSTVMLLTILWGSCVVVGKCDFSEESTAIDMQDSRGFSLSGSGISTDIQTSHAAKIMIVSVIPFIIVQLPNVFRFSSAEKLAVLIALVLSIALLLTYCFYQIYQPWIMKRRFEYAKLVFSDFLWRGHLQSSGRGRFLTDDGLLDENVIKKLFSSIDTDSNNVISRAELTALLVGISFDDVNVDYHGAVDRMMKDLDTSQDGNIDLEEFITGMKRWLDESKSTPNFNPFMSKFGHDFHEPSGQERNENNDNGDDNVEAEDKEKPEWVWIKALLLLTLGTFIAVAFADPLVDAVDNFSSATHIPSFFISFIAMPLATNSSEAVSALIFASRKKQKTASLTFSEIYGSATMNNTLCLSVFLALVYLRGLTWDFSSEVLVILLVCIIMGLLASFRTSFPLWTSFLAFLLYPLSLMLAYILDYVFGWS